MGLEDSGSDVVLGGLVMDDEMKQLYTTHCGVYKRAMISSLGEKLCACETADDNFKVGFVLFALGTVLCPTSSLSVSGNYLRPLRRTREIKMKNWARHGFKYFIKGVRVFKENGSVYLNGCLLFLQLFYLDVVVKGRSYVDRGVHPIVAWNNKLGNKLIKWVTNNGGFDSPTIDVVSNHSKMGSQYGVNIEGIAEKVAAIVAEKVAATVGQQLLEAVNHSLSEFREQFASIMKEGTCENPEQPHLEKDIANDDEVVGKVNEGNNPVQPVEPERQSSIQVSQGEEQETELKKVVEKRNVRKVAAPDTTRMQTRRTTERHPSKHQKSSWEPLAYKKGRVNPSFGKQVGIGKTQSKIKIGPLKLKVGDLDDADMDLFSYLFNENDASSTEPIIKTEDGYYLSKGELLCLRHEKWLTDRLMNTKISYLHEVEQRYGILLHILRLLLLGQ